MSSKSLFSIFQYDFFFKKILWILSKNLLMTPSDYFKKSFDDSLDYWGISPLIYSEMFSVLFQRLAWGLLHKFIDDSVRISSIGCLRNFSKISKIPIKKTSNKSLAYHAWIQIEFQFFFPVLQKLPPSGISQKFTAGFCRKFSLCCFRITFKNSFINFRVSLKNRNSLRDFSKTFSEGIFRESSLESFQNYFMVFLKKSSSSIPESVPGIPPKVAKYRRDFFFARVAFLP